MRIYIKAFLSGFIFIMGGTWWQATAQNGKDIIIGKRLAFHSDVLQEEREILLHLPASYDQNNYTRYPVLYLLDGQKFFQSFTGATEQLSQDASPQIPEIIIVGISSQNRVRDASPTHSLTGYRGIKEKELEASGGADKFLSFVKTELIPFIDSSYRTQPYRLFTGYSFTGLPVLHSLFTQPGLFNSYLVIDFSAWWDNQVTLKKMMGFFKQEVLKKADVFLCTEERVKNSVYPERVNATWTFIKAFEKLHPSSISMGYKKYGLRQENHHSMPLQAFMDGLRYLFRGYMINQNASS